MYDTTGWKINVSSEQVKKILSRSKEFSEYDHETETTTFRILKDNLHIGSYDSNITIKCYESQQVYIEFSIPKQYLGNNVELLYPSQLDQALVGVERRLIDRFGTFPSYKTWCLQRLDLCYGWRYNSQESAEEILKILKTFDYPRKNKYLYHNSVMWKASTSTIKFYLKHPEFIKHDYKKLLKLGENEFANRILALSEGVLRFEITYRKQGIDYLFNKKEVMASDLLNIDLLETALSISLNRLTMNLEKSVLDDNEAIKRLEACYSSRKAIRLFTFYKSFNSPKLNQRQILKDRYNNSTIYRNKKDIAKAKLGLSIDTVPFTFNLEIPSELVVNTDKARSGGSRAA
jgi:hypothetical protein